MTPGFDLTDWQLFVYALFSLLVLFSAWQGWLHGMGRSLLIIVGVGVGFLAGKALGFIILNIYDSFLPYPKPIVELLTDIIFGVLVYTVFVAASVFMFKSTRKQTELKKKLISGIGGVFFGIINGLIVTIAIVIAVRTFGILQMTIPPIPGSVEYRQKQDVYLPEHLKENAKLTVNLSRALTTPPIEKWTLLSNPIPEKYFTLLKNLKVFAEREDLLEAFVQQNEIQQLLSIPEIASVVNESTIPQQIETGSFYALLKNPSFHELYNKETTAVLMNEMDWIELTSNVVENSDLANHPDL